MRGEERREASPEGKQQIKCIPTCQGETGSYLYVAAEGQFEVCKAGRVLGNLGVGKVFGELAILYNCRRTASIRAVVDSKVWALERRVFQQVMVASGLRRMVHQVGSSRLGHFRSESQVLRLASMPGKNLLL